jgi:catechol 1,2-dioxygenase
VDDDVAEAVKPELVLTPQSSADGELTSTYDFVLERA